MAESGAAQRISGVATAARAAARGFSQTDWSRIAQVVRGPLLTLATAIGFDVLARHHAPIAYPFPFLILTAVYSTYRGGIWPGILSALVTLLYALHFLSGPGTPFHYTPANAYSLLALAIVVPATVLLVARLHDVARHAKPRALASGGGAGRAATGLLH